MDNFDEKLFWRFKNLWNALDSDDIQAEPIDVLINRGSCLPDLEELRCGFGVKRFLDFRVGSGAAVFHNRLCLVGINIGTVNPVLITLTKAGFVRGMTACIFLIDKH